MHKDDIKIMVVDDDSVSAFSIAEHLKLYNFRVQTATSGQETIALFENSPADILITDIVMPGMNGIILAKQIINQYPDTVIIGISAHDDLKPAIQFMKLGCLDFLQKPVELENLDQAIQHAIHRLELKKQLEWTQAELIQKNKALETHKNNLQSIFNAMNDMVFILDSTGCVLYVNPIVCTHLGYSNDEVIGMNILELHAPQHLKDVSTFVTEMLEGKDTLFVGHLMKKEGGSIDVETKVTKAIWNEHKALIGVSRDVTQYKQARRDMKIAQAESKAKSEFLANVSHDLRTPLNGILGYTQVLIRDKHLHDRYQEQIQIIHKCGEHLLLLINDILDLSKIEAGKMELQLADFYFDDFLQRIVDICQVFARKKKIQLNFFSSPDCPKCVRGDEKRLRQVLLNIMNNAIKFTFKGSVSLDVKMIDNNIRFTIKDTGIGIPQDKLTTIFEPFRQLDDQRHQTEGTGLGLAISQRIIQLMEGDIFVKSIENQGSTFWFEIHLPEVFHHTKKRSGHKWSNVNGKGLRVLIVDDNYLNRKFFAQMLEFNKFDIFEAEDGFQAIEKTEQIQPHFILMDLMMPKMSGIDAIEEIRKKPENKDIVIFTISANTELEEKCLKKPNFCNHFLQKPIDMDEFYNELQKHLNIVATKIKSDQDNPSLESEPETIIPPDHEKLNQMYQMAKTGNVLRIEKMAIKLENQNIKFKPFAKQVIEMAKGFQINELKAFLEDFLT